MKYLGFLAFAAVGVPLMVAAVIQSQKLRAALISLLIFSCAIGDKANINFLSVGHYRGPDRGFEIALTDLIAISLCIYLLSRHSTRLRWSFTAIVPMTLLFCLSTVSVFLSPEPLFGMFTLFKAIRFALLTWCLTNLVVIERHVAAIRWGFISIGFFALTIALKQKYVDGIYRIPLWFDHSNTVPLFLNLVMPILLLWGLCDRRLSKLESLAAIVSSLGMVVAVVATYSRAGMAIAAAEVLACLGIALVRAPGRRVKVTGILVLLAMIAGGIKVSDSIWDRVRNAPKSSEVARHEFNVAARMMAADNMLGVGLNNFSVVLTRTDRYRAHIAVMANEDQSGVAHHVYWLTAAELGWAGLVLFLMVIARIAWVAFRTGLGVTSPEGYALTGAAIGFMAVHMSGFLEWALRITPVSFQFAIVTGVVCGCAELVRRSRKEHSAARVAPASIRSGTLIPVLHPGKAGTIPAMQRG